MVDSDCQSILEYRLGVRYLSPNALIYSTSSPFTVSPYGYGGYKSFLQNKIKQGSPFLQPLLLKSFNGHLFFYVRCQSLYWAQPMAQSFPKPLSKQEEFEIRGAAGINPISGLFRNGRKSGD